MNLNITGHHIEVTPALRDYVSGKVDKVIRHFDHVTSVHVILSVEKLVQKAEITLHLKGKDIYADSFASEGVADLSQQRYRPLRRHRSPDRQAGSSGAEVQGQAL